MRFKDILLEALPLSVAKKYTKLWKPEYAKALFQKYTNDPKAYRIYFPLEENTSEKLAVPKEIKDYLNDKGYEILDYKEGIAERTVKTQQGEKKQKVKIGAILKEEPTLLKSFNERLGGNKTKESNLLVCISRHPYDIAGMSTNRGWTSCMNLETGCNKKYVEQDVKQGSLIAYLINSDDKNINHPIGRILIMIMENYQQKDGSIKVPKALQKYCGFKKI